MTTPLQKAQRNWAWRKAILKSCEGHLIHTAMSIPLSDEKIEQLSTILKDMNNANDAKFKALGGNPKCSK